MTAAYIIAGTITVALAAFTLYAFIRQKKDASYHELFRESVKILTIWSLLCLPFPLMREIAFTMGWNA